jgi:hypothetical protein
MNRGNLSVDADKVIANKQNHKPSNNGQLLYFLQVIFMPVSDNILACFQDDSIHIWNFDTFECIKQILPEAWKSHHLKSIAFTREV